jgi:hypothetical protein
MAYIRFFYMHVIKSMNINNLYEDSQVYEDILY